MDKPNSRSHANDDLRSGEASAPPLARAMPLRLVAAAVAMLPLLGCVGDPRPMPAAVMPTFDPITFFDGPTVGVGRLKKLFSKPEATLVNGSGRVHDGTLLLDQAVSEAAKSPTHRHWKIRRVAPGRFAGTLSDAPGGIIGEVAGNRLHLAFTMKGGLATQQWLTLAPDGRSAHNIMIVRKLGVRVAVLDEEIRKTQ